MDCTIRKYWLLHTALHESWEAYVSGYQNFQKTRKLLHSMYAQTPGNRGVGLSFPFTRFRLACGFWRVVHLLYQGSSWSYVFLPPTSTTHSLFSVTILCCQISRHQSTNTYTKSYKQTALSIMSVVSLLGVNILNNPAKFTDGYQFEITFECLEQLEKGKPPAGTPRQIMQTFQTLRHRSNVVLPNRPRVEADLRWLCDLRPVRPRARHPAGRPHPRRREQVHL